MKLEKAIEILTQHQKGTDPLYLPDLPDAEKLGIEALKRVIARREKLSWEFEPLLPGETVE